MVENLVSSYKCPFCGSTNIWENNIDIVGAAGNTVNIDMHCPSCKRHFMAKTEVMQMDIGNIPANKISEVSKALAALKGKLGGNIEIETEFLGKDNQSIADESITDLQKNMRQKEFTAEDLFSDNNETWKK